MAAVKVNDQLNLAFAQIVKDQFVHNLDKNILHVTDFSDAPIPLSKTVGANHQRWSIYKFLDHVPKDDSPNITSSGDSYFEALRTYLSWAKLPDEVAINNDSAVSTLYKKISDVEGQARDDLAGIKKDYTAQFAPDYIDPATGERITLPQFMRTNHPEYLTLREEIQSLNSQLEGLIAASSFTPLKQLYDWEAACVRANDTNQDNLGFNMQVVAMAPSSIDSVASGTVNDALTQRAPLFQIDGDFDRVCQGWVDSFPKDYPANSDAFVAGCQIKEKMDLSTSTTQSWTDFGFSESTHTSSTSAWIFYSNSSTTTNKDVFNNQNSSIDKFTEGVDVKIWKAKVFPTTYGNWRKGNPSHTFPNLRDGAPPAAKPDVSCFISEVILAYGIELTFHLADDLITKINNVVTDTSSSQGSMGVFGSLYGSGDSSSSSRTKTFDSLSVDTAGKTLTLRAQDDGVPIVIGVVAAKVD